MTEKKSTPASSFEELQQENLALKARIAELEQTELALRESQERYDLAMEGPNEGLWDWNPISKELLMSTRLLATFGVESQSKYTTTHEWLEWVHPDDRAFYQKILVDHLKGLSDHFECEYRVRDKDGQYRWILARGLALRDEAGIAYRMVGSIGDITDRKNAEQALKKAHEELETRVDERTKALVSLNNQLQIEVSQRKVTEQALKIAKDEAEQANRSKDKYLAAASHDLLQPLNAARLLVATLQERTLPPTDQRAVERIHLALESAEELLTDLLEISKLDQNAVTPVYSAFSIKTLFFSLQNEFRAVAQKNKLDFKVVTSSLAIYSDQRLLGRILRNLLSNAFRYTQNGRVLLGCRRKGNFLNIEVWDTGPGIAPDKQAIIFEEFQKLDSYSHSPSKGVGLGLTIVDRIGTMLGHRITLRSSVGKGSCFSVRVPIRDLTPCMAAPEPAYRVHVQNFEGALVLVIDNETTIVDSMAMLLAEWGCQVLPAISYGDALNVCLHAKVLPDIILADYHLSHGATGVEAILALRKALKADIPAAVITANRENSVRKECVSHKFPILNKPVEPTKLRALLSHVLGSEVRLRLN